MDRPSLHPSTARDSPFAALTGITPPVSDVATQSKSFLEVFFIQWVPILSLACLAVKGLFSLKNTIADTKNTEWDTKLKQWELKMKEQEFAEQQKKDSQAGDFPRLEYPKFEPISGSTWLVFLILAALNAVAFLFVTYTQPLTTFSLGMLIASVLAAGLSLAMPLCVALSKNVAYSNDLHAFTALQFFYANARLAKVQIKMLQTQGALATGQFEAVNVMLTKAASEFQAVFDRIRNKLTREQLQIADPAFKEFLGKLQQASNQIGDILDKARLATKKAQEVKLLDPEQSANKPS